MQASLFIDSANRDTWHEGNSKTDGPDAEASSWLVVVACASGSSAASRGKVTVPYAWMDAKTPCR